MSDARVTPNPERITRSDPAQIIVPLVDLCRAPEGPRDRQLIYGDAVTVLGDYGGWHYIKAKKDGYCGYVKEHALGPITTITHNVIAPATHAYEDANLKSPEHVRLSFASRITALSEGEGFVQTSQGYIPKQHLALAKDKFDDPATVAALFLGTPYLWGGNSRDGIDCSGLIQTALHACGTDCPGDSDMQTALGKDATGPYQRNDLLFWKGHVALVVDETTLIHANAGAMATTYEGISDAIERIKAQGDGPVTAHRRL